MLGRRDFIAGISIASLCQVKDASSASEDDGDYKEYRFIDYFDPHHLIPFGIREAPESDRNAALELALAMPKSEPIEVMKSLSAITKTGSTNEVFNSRWKELANPLIVLFFHDIGYRETPYPGDCTPWCAATVSWCLKRCGLPIPAAPASSQSYLHYGRSISIHDAKSGDLCVFTDLKSRSNGHVGFFVPGAPVGYVNCLGGNQEGRSQTNCGPGYRKSKVSLRSLPVNASKDPRRAGLFLASIRSYR